MGFLDLVNQTAPKPKPKPPAHKTEPAKPAKPRAPRAKTISAEDSDVFATIVAEWFQIREKRILRAARTGNASEIMRRILDTRKMLKTLKQTPLVRSIVKRVERAIEIWESAQ